MVAGARSKSAQKRLFLALIDAMAERHRPILAIRISAAGEVTLLTEAPEGVLAANDDGDWVRLAGAKDLPRA